MIDVVAALLWHGERFLICKRPEGKARALLWEFVGGKVEKGETDREALVREIREELSTEATTGRFLGVVENAFQQHGKPHAEINLVYELLFENPPVAPTSAEDWISFEWCPLSDIDSANLLPEAFRRLGTDSFARFEP